MNQHIHNEEKIHHVHIFLLDHLSIFAIHAIQLKEIYLIINKIIPLEYTPLYVLIIPIITIFSLFPSPGLIIFVTLSFP